MLKVALCGPFDTPKTVSSFDCKQCAPSPLRADLAPTKTRFHFPKRIGERAGRIRLKERVDTHSVGYFPLLTPILVLFTSVGSKAIHLSE